MRKLIHTCFLTLLILQGADDFANGQARIIGGGTAADGDYPWMTALVEKGRSPAAGQFCGGMLVAPQWVLTAAHCVEGETPNSIDAWINIHDLRVTGGASKRRVVAIFKHPNYRADRFDNLFYDAALLLLDRPVSDVTPLAMAFVPRHNDVGEIARSLGWGTTDPFYDVYPNILRQVDMPIVDIADAQADYQNVLGPSHLAAGGDGVRDTCTGDSGGPLFRNLGGRNLLLGIVSFGEGCAVPDVEGIYTNVLHIRPWIDSWLQLTTQAPEKSVRSKGRVINNADNSPSRTDGTHFGSVRTGRRGISNTYRLRNDEAGLLIVLSASVSHRSFKFRHRPPSTVLPNRAVLATIKFKPRRRGIATAIVRINSNDPSDPFFWFRIRGKGR